MENKCPLCGKINPETEWVCESCGAKLPMAGKREQVARSVASPVTTPNTQKKPNATGVTIAAFVVFCLFVLLPLKCVLSPENPRQIASPRPENLSDPARGFVREAPPLVAPKTGVRTGARCVDGTYSSATGSGACSRHGGVANWITN